MKQSPAKSAFLLTALFMLVGCSDQSMNSVATISESGSGIQGGMPMEEISTEVAESSLTADEMLGNEPAAVVEEIPATEEAAAATEVVEITETSAPAAAEEPAVVETTKQPAAKAAEPVAASPVASSAKASAGDWTMWGGSPSRNMVSSAKGLDLSFEAAETKEEGKNLVWTEPLGSQTYGNPIVAEGRVLVGTNNGGEYRPAHEGDRGCLICFDQKDGTFLWQLTREKLQAGRVNDWPEQGICSTPCVEDGLVYVATNRCELMCLDLDGFHDGKNDGPYTDEVDTEKLDADIVWSLDMIDELGVFPHNLATSSPVIHGDLIFMLTSNGVDEAHLEVPSPRAPCFIAVNKKTGKVVWEDNSPALDSMAPAPFDNILHGQWGSPAMGEVNGKMQVFMPGGDGVLYTYDALTGDLVWWFDLNPKDSAWELGGRGTRNAIISTPVFKDNSVILAVGQDPEHGEGVGHLYRIDATKTGDLSTQIADGDGWKANPNSGEIWEYGGIDADGEITGEKNGLIFRRTISTVAIHNGLVYAPDLSGFLHCIDYKTGQKKWVYDTFAAVWGSPMVADGHVMLGDEDGEMVVLKAGGEMEVLETKVFNSSIYSTPTIANGMMFVSDRSRLYAFKVQ